MPKSVFEKWKADMIAEIKGMKTAEDLRQWLHDEAERWDDMKRDGELE